MRMASSLATNQSAASSLKDQLKRSSLGGSGGGDGGSSDSASVSCQPHHQRLVHRYKNGDVSVLFCSVETECELCRLPFYHLHTTGVFLFHSVRAWLLVLAIGSTPRPCSLIEL